MSLKFPKIRVGKFGSSRKPQDLSHSTVTSADFGFCQPISCAQIVGGSSFNTKVAAKVMLNPLNAPTYGKMFFNLYHGFVPFADLYAPFEHMLLETPYTSTKLTHVPTAMPYIRTCDLTRLVLGCHLSAFTIYKEVNTGSSAYTKIPSSEVTNALNNFKNQFPYVDTSSTHFSDDSCSNSHSNFTNVEMEGADYLVKFTVGSVSHIIVWRFSRTIRHLRLVLNGLGYVFDLNSTRKLPVMPLFCYYRFWFELFAPKQSVSWESTNAYKILDVIKEEGPTFLPLMKQFEHQSGNTNIIEQFFFNDIAGCYYTEDPDFISAHIATPSLTFNNTSANYSGPITLDQKSVAAAPNRMPVLNGDISALGLDVLRRLSTRIGKQTVLGSQLSKAMKVLFGYDYVGQDKCYIIGTQRIPIQITDVTSTSDTLDVGGNTGDVLGARGAEGNGNNFNNLQNFTFETTSEGCYICIGVIVAETGYFQGVPGYLTCVDKLDYFHKEYDALGYELSQKDMVVGYNDVILSTGHNDPASFGLIPRYTGAYKVRQNIVNGDVSLRSTRDSLLTFTLDKFISPNSLTSYVNDSGQTIIKTYTSNIPIASTQWRYQNMYPWMGNLNRIFVNEGFGLEDSVSRRTQTPLEKMEYEPILDNFIVNCYVDLLAFEPMLPKQDSFDTDPFDDASEVEKA